MCKEHVLAHRKASGTRLESFMVYCDPEVLFSSKVETDSDFKVKSK
jgi:hypothetical protein